MSAPSRRQRVAIIGECLVELRGTPFATLTQTFGGDTLNTAIYLARLSQAAVDVRFITSLGVDVLSEGMLQRWQAEGILTDLVVRDPKRLPGLYLIQVDPRGERRFLYWRSASAARYLLQHAEFDRIASALAGMDFIYLSGITLAILPEDDRATLTTLLLQLANRGATVVFDSNFRPALWASPDSARAAMSALMPAVRAVLTTFDDEQRLWLDPTPAATRQRLHDAGVPLVVIKLGAEGCLYSHAGAAVHVPAVVVEAVADTTAAGDAFNAGFLAARLAGREVPDCCRAGNRLAASVIQYHGAIIPLAATATLPELLGDAIP